MGEVVGEEEGEALGSFEGERVGTVLAVGCTEAVSEMLAVAVGVGLRDVLALPESSQHEALLLAPVSE